MKRSILSRAVAMVLAVLLILGCVLLPTLAAEQTGVTVKLHYNRPDGNYEGWSVWFWVDGVESADVPFAEENGEMVAAYSVPAGAASVGFIVKLPSWAAKDVDMDQFIDVAAYLSGTVHVYVESGVEGYTVKTEGDVITGVKIKEAVYRPGEGIQVTMTEEISDYVDGFAVSGITGCVGGDVGGGKYIVTTQEDLDPFGSYTGLVKEPDEKPVQDVDDL